MKLDLVFAGIELSHPIMNASGPRCTTQAELQQLEESSSSAIVSKSATLEPRIGNPEPRYVETSWGSINSMGLPNLGWEFYARQSFSKPYIVSVSGLSLEENKSIINGLSLFSNISAIELNLSCPNLPGKPQTGYDFDQIKNVLDEILPRTNHVIGLKLPPYFDVIHFEEVAKILNQYPISFVTCINSIGNGLFIEDETVVIKPKAGFGGLGGSIVKPTALANVRAFSQLLRSDIQVIGTGGIQNGQDVFEHILCGATAVQVGTQFMKEGIGVFDRLLSELKEIMKKKNYQSLEDFRGKLKTLN